MNKSTTTTPEGAGEFPPLPKIDKRALLSNCDGYVHAYARAYAEATAALRAQAAEGEPSAPEAAPAKHVEAWTWFDGEGKHHLSVDEPGEGETTFQLTALVAAEKSPLDQLKGLLPSNFELESTRSEVSFNNTQYKTEWIVRELGEHGWGIGIRGRGDTPQAAIRAALHAAPAPASEAVAWRYRIKGGAWEYQSIPFFAEGSPGPGEEHEALTLFDLLEILASTGSESGEAVDHTEALRTAQRAIESMKQEAETAAMLDETAMLEALERISNDGLAADMAIRAALQSAQEGASHE